MRNILSQVALAATVALGGHMSANAAAFDLGPIDGTETVKAVTSPGSFNDLYTFSTWDSSLGGFAAQSIVFQASYGVTISSIAVYEGAFTNPAELATAQIISAPQTSTSTSGSYATVVSLATFGAIETNQIYTFQIAGSSIGTAGYTGIIALTDNVPNVPPIPEPETYAMLLAGLGMMGMIARRRQKQR